jgi:dehydrogenase/reductase SDR family member 12
MARYYATVESRRSAAETFGYLAAFSNAAEWDPGVLAGAQLDPGPVRAGSRFRLVVPFLGVRMSLTYEVIRLVPGREVLLHAASALLQSTDRIVVTGDADGSTVSYDAEVRLRGPLQLLDPLLRPGFRAVAERAAAGLADTLSGRPPGGGTGTPAVAPARSGGAKLPMASGSSAIPVRNAL